MSTPESLIVSTQDTLKRVLADKFPNAIDFGDGSYAIPYGSSSVMIVVRPFTETDTMVEFMAQVVTDATITDELMRWLLRKNVELHFGGFGLLFDDTIVFSYAIPGANLSTNEIEAAITSVSIIADHYDDEIVKMAGGKRAIDATIE